MQGISKKAGKKVAAAPKKGASSTGATKFAKVLLFYYVNVRVYSKHG